MAAVGFTDRYGLSLSTTSAAAVEHYDEGVDRLLGLNAGFDESFLAAIAADEGFALAHAARTIVLQQQQKIEEAKASAERARALSEGLSRRERQHVTVVAALVDGPADRATALIREHLVEFPRDALLFRQLSLSLALGAAPGRKEQMKALLDEFAAAFGDDWFYLAARAMWLQDAHRFEEARRDAERALTLRPRAALAAHPVAHVFYETDDHTGGVAFLRDWLAGYEPYAPYFSHLSWHQALAELAMGHNARVAEILDMGIRPHLRRSPVAVADAVSLTWRCQLYDAVAPPLPWAALREVIDSLPGRPGMLFRDAHIALLYAATGDDMALSQLIDNLRDLGEKGNPTAADVALPLVQGIAAYMQAHYREAIRLIERVADRISDIGGSNAQREVFEDTLLDAYLRAGEFDRAESLLRRRLDRRPSARDYFWLGRAQAGRGDGASASASLAEARNRWNGADADAPEQANLAALEASLNA